MSKGFFIVFLGVDGAGKTTVTKLLKSNLESQYAIKSNYIWFRSSIQNTISGLLSGSPNENIEADKVPKKSTIFHKLYNTIYQNFVLLDYFIISIIKIKIPRFFGTNIVLDRYIYDIILDLSNTYNYNSNKLKRFVNSKCFTNPDLVFYIDVPADVAFNRKQEHPINIIDLKIKQFDLLERILSDKIQFIRLDGTKKVDELVGEIMLHLIKNGVVVLDE